MNNFKNNIKGNFTTIPNILVNDKELSLKAKGLFMYLASKPNDWDFYVKQITSSSSNGKQSVQSGLKELEEAEYLTRTRIYDDKTGKILGWKWILDLPQSASIVNGSTNAVLHPVDNPSKGETTQRKSASYNNTNNTNTNNTNTNNNTSVSGKPDDTDAEGADTEEKDQIDHKFWVDLWNEENDTSCRVTDPKRVQIRNRLKTYTKEELVRAIKFRARIDDFMNGKGKKYKKQWDTFWRNDEKPAIYLQRYEDYTSEMEMRQTSRQSEGYARGFSNE